MTRPSSGSEILPTHAGLRTEVTNPEAGEPISDASTTPEYGKHECVPGMEPNFLRRHRPQLTVALMPRRQPSRSFLCCRAPAFPNFTLCSFPPDRVSRPPSCKPE